MLVLHVYGMILQWIGVMQHQLGCVAPEEGQHVSSMHLPSIFFKRIFLGLLVLTLAYKLVKWKYLSQQK